MKKFYLLLLMILVTITSVILIAQGTGTPNQIRVKVDATNALVTAFAAQVLPLSNPTVFSNTRIRTDTSGNLVVTDGTGAGFAPANATYITQTANAGLSAEQALSSLATGLMNVTTTTGVITSITDVAVGQVLCSAGLSTTPVWCSSPQVTALNSSQTALGTTSTDGVILQNTTASTVGTPVQISPRVRICGTAFNSVSALSEINCFKEEILPATNAGVTTATWGLWQSIASGAYGRVLGVNSSGAITFDTGNVTATVGSFVAGNNIQLATGSSVAWGSAGSGRGRIVSPTDGLFRFNNTNTTNTSVEMNVGTAVPTVANCSVGTTGTISANSTNSGGEVNPGSSSTSCDVVFGAPNWTFAPFCVITDETSVILAPRISARSTTGFTVTGLTAGDKFLYVCVGGGI